MFDYNGHTQEGGTVLQVCKKGGLDEKGGTTYYKGGTWDPV
jgi:hypothetical protein